MKIFVVGMPGSGKSYWGKIWAHRLQLPFFDLDSEIEKTCGNSVSAIFNEEGEEFFRTIENQTITKISSTNNFLMACGGGTPCFYNQMDFMNKNGITVFINPSLDEISNNLLKSTNERPLLNNEESLPFQLKKILEERLPFYQLAQFTINSPQLNEDALLNILNLTAN